MEKIRLKIVYKRKDNGYIKLRIQYLEIVPQSVLWASASACLFEIS